MSSTTTVLLVIAGICIVSFSVILVCAGLYGIFSCLCYMGLERRVKESLPVFEYKTQSFKDALECAVCLSEFQENDKGRFLPNCQHSFHIDCIDKWFHSHLTCPICRTGVRPKQLVGNNNTHEISMNAKLISSNSASVQDSHKGKQAVTKQKPPDESPSTSGKSSLPEIDIDMPGRSKQFS